MLLSDVKINDIVELKLPHWHVAKFAQAEKFKKVYCQLHGDYIGDGILFREIKPSGKLSVLFILMLDEKLELLRLVTAQHDNELLIKIEERLKKMQDSLRDSSAEKPYEKKLRLDNLRVINFRLEHLQKLRKAS